MFVVRAAFCPHPPLLVPALAAGAAGELADLRSACAAVISELCAAELDAIVVVGAGPVGWWPPQAVATLARYGLPGDLTAAPLSDPGALRAAPTNEPSAPHDPLSGLAGLVGAGAQLPLSLTIGCWLLGQHQPRVPVHALSLDAAEQIPDLCEQIGAVGGRLGLLVLGDGAACHGEQAPGYADPRATDFDQAVAAALASADRTALRDLDLAVAADLRAAGVLPWRLVGALTAGQSGRWQGQLTHQAAPYGVGYLVADWWCTA